MNARPQATRSACFQPDNYVDLGLFADRTDVLEDLVGRLRSFLEPGAPGNARILVRGHRGVGKSILTRKAIDEVVGSLAVLRVIVDGARTGHGPDALMKRLAADLGREATQHATDAGLEQGAELLQRFATMTRVSVKDVRQWSKAMSLGANFKSKLVESVQFEFGLSGTASRVRSVEETYERVVDAEFLREKIQDFLTDCRAVNQAVILFADNLDQVGYSEIHEDVRRVTDLARTILGFEDCVAIANLRTEFVSSDVRKLSTSHVEIKGLSPAELVIVAQARLRSAGGNKQRALEGAGFDTLIATLATWTTNAWGLLNWLADLDYVPIDFDPADAAKLRAALLGIAENRYAGLRVDEISSVAKAFDAEPAGFRTANELDTHGVTQELRERAVRYGVLVPDWLLSPDRYMLSPGLHFLSTRWGVAPAG